MANTIQIKRGSGAPGSLADGELGFDKTNNILYIGKGSSVVALDYVKRSGDTMTGNLTIHPSVTGTGGAGRVVIEDNVSNGSMLVGFGTGHQYHGLYSSGYAPTNTTWTDDGKYMVYRNSSGDIILNGNALNDSDGNKINSTYLKLAGGTLSAGAQIIRAGKSSSWYNGRDYAIFRANSISGYSAFLSLKTTNGSWEIGSYDASGAYDKLAFNYTPDSSYSSSTNTGTVRVYLNSNGVLEGTATRATGDGDGNTISSTYLKLSGGSLSGWVWHSAEVGDIYDTERYVSGGGGWSYTPIRFRSAPLGSYFFTIGAYGADNALTYAFIGPSTSYSSSSNMRIYPSGAITVGGNLEANNGNIYAGTSSGTTEHWVEARCNGNRILIDATSTKRGIWADGAGWIFSADKGGNVFTIKGNIDQIVFSTTQPSSARSGLIWIKPV